jgi:hypothetical protein
MTPITAVRESLARLEERERARSLLLDERFDRQDEMLLEIKAAVVAGEAERKAVSLRVGALEREKDRAKAWLAGAVFVGTSIGGLGAWLISLVGK